MQTTLQQIIQDDDNELEPMTSGDGNETALPQIIKEVPDGDSTALLEEVKTEDGFSQGTWDEE